MTSQQANAVHLESEIVLLESAYLSISAHLSTFTERNYKHNGADFNITETVFFSKNAT